MLDLVIPVLCVFLRIKSVAQGGLEGISPKRAVLSWALQRVFPSHPALNLQGVKTHLVVQLPGAREGFFHVRVTAGAPERKIPPYFFWVKNYFE